MLQRLIAVFALSLAACSSSPNSTCEGYCQSDLECGRIDRAGLTTCVKACASRATAATDACRQSFLAYASCYDDSATCRADDCYDRFVAFADSCSWHTEEVGLSSQGRTRTAVASRR